MGNKQLKDFYRNGLGIKAAYYLPPARNSLFSKGFEASYARLNAYSVYYNDSLIVFHKGLKVAKLPNTIRNDISSSMTTGGVSIQFAPEYEKLQSYATAGLGVTYIRSVCRLADFSLGQWYIKDAQNLIAQQRTSSFTYYLNFNLGFKYELSATISVYLRAGYTYTGLVTYMDYSNTSLWKLDYVKETPFKADILQAKSIRLIDDDFIQLKQNLSYYQAEAGVFYNFFKRKNKTRSN
ncbi:MAG: hypothetical protein IPO27_17030 [Bacteroidetes bacterium]|nr:hypothetical protein [Bacteroidota bacterium]